MERANLDFVDEVKRLGAPDLSACYSCGTCSAVCPLSKDELSFPRKMIRYSLLGLEGRILSSPEPWLCYYCGECSKTCPREADPGGLMMALRRFTIRKYSIGRVADAFYSAFASGVAWIVLTAIAIAAIFLFYNPAMDRAKVDFLSFISLENIHVAGIAIVVFIMAALLGNIWIMYRSMRRGPHGAAFSMSNVKAPSMKALREVALQERFGECEDNKFRRWAHLAVSWGFMGMFLATCVILGGRLQVDSAPALGVARDRLGLGRGDPFRARVLHLSEAGPANRVFETLPPHRLGLSRCFSCSPS